MTDQAELELLERIITIAEHALAPEPGVTVPPATWRDLLKEAEAVAAKPCASSDDRLMGDEAVMLVRCLTNAELQRLDGDVERATRWRFIAQCFLPFLRTDRARAIAGRQILR